MTIERILVGAPASRRAAAALMAAAELASSHDAELVVLHLEAILDARRVFDPDGVPEPLDDLQLRQSYPGLRLRSHQARGNPLRQVCRVAEEERPDLIVVPQGGRGPTSLLSRRASSALAQRASCPVLMVAS